MTADPRKPLPSAGIPGATVEAVLEVHARLKAQFGPRPWRVEKEPILDSLIATILSQNTNDANSGRAFAQLKAAFPDWESARAAPVERLESEIRAGGLARLKARRIKDILEEVHRARGVTSLEHLRRAPTPRLRSELGRFRGVGPKTIACVLVFNLGRPDFPVDTHIHRIAGRLGWRRAKASAEDTYQLLNRLVPGKLKYELHVLLITLGRRTCRSQHPRCLECPLWSLCPHGRNELRASRP
jgi:endonuclease-3